MQNKGSLSTYSPTATRTGHRMIAAAAALRRWTLASLDISTAFLQGWTYAEMEADTPGTITGLTYAAGGKKVVMEDKDGLVAAVRDALTEEDEGPEGVEEKA